MLAVRASWPIGGSQMARIEDFMALYDELAGDVQAAEANYVREHLKNWFDHLDEPPWARAIVRRLQGDFDINAYLNDPDHKTKGIGAQLVWPTDRMARLAARLALFREIAEGRLDVINFAINYTYEKGGVTQSVRRLLDQVFTPTTKELRRILVQEGNAADSQSAPASDRVVRLDHNSARYKEITEALEVFEKAIRESNEAYDDPELREQHLAEVSAARRLLEPVRVRIGAVVALVGGAASYIAMKFIDTGIGKVAGALLDKLHSWATSLITNAPPLPF